jgi:hypothetical protein
MRCTPQLPSRLNAIEYISLVADEGRRGLELSPGETLREESFNHSLRKPVLDARLSRR